MKKSILTFASMAVLVLTCISCINLQSTFSEGSSEHKVLILTEAFTSSTVRQVLASTSGGSIKINGDAGKQGSIEVYAQGNNGRTYSKEEIMEILDRDYNLEVGQDGAILKAIAERKVKGSWKNALSISYVIHVGKQVNTELSTSGGSIRLSNLQGNQSFKTSGGSLRLEALSGTIDGKTSGGNIYVKNSQGTIRLNTSGGSIEMQQLQGDIQTQTSGGSIKGQGIAGSLRTKTSGGSIRLSDIAASLDAKTSGGSIRADFSSFVKPASLHTSGGSIGLNVPGDAQMDFELEGSTVSVGEHANLQTHINKERNHATGSLNGGDSGALLNASTSGGTVRLEVR